MTAIPETPPISPLSLSPSRTKPAVIPGPASNRKVQDSLKTLHINGKLI